MKNKKRLFRGLFAVFLVSLLLIPIGVAIAETPVDFGEVSKDAGYVLGDTYQRHNFYSDERHWVFWTNASAIVYTSSDDLDTWTDVSVFVNHSCDQEPEMCCNASDFTLWYNKGLDRVGIAYFNVSGENHTLYYNSGTPLANGSITWNTSSVAATATANLTFSHPSLCDNSENYPYVAYMVYNSSGTDYDGYITTSNASVGTWVNNTNSTVKCTTMINGSYNILYPSVVPVTNGSVSVQYPYNSEVIGYQVSHNIASYNVTTDLWTYNNASSILPASSSLFDNKLWWHSEVAYPSVNSSDDVYFLCTANDTILGGILLFDRWGTSWNSDDSLETDDYRATISIRNGDGDLVLTAINGSGNTGLYSADFTQSTLSWSNITSVHTESSLYAAYVMSGYTNGSPVGFLTLTDTEGTLDLDLGEYGVPTPTPVPTATPSAVPESVTTMAWIVVLVFGALICILLLGYGAYEASRGQGGVELVKMGAIGLITFVIAAIIVANMLV